MCLRPASPLYRRIYALVQQIPPGYVTTYGRVGQLIGCTARTVGFAMAALPPGSDVPWQRVINRLGQVSRRSDGEGNILQRDLLAAEGLVFDRKAQLDLAKYAWTFPEFLLEPDGSAGAEKK
jgi:methylated-DNA-protein-cysteine methyltransferase-like protein